MNTKPTLLVLSNRPSTDTLVTASLSDPSSGYQILRYSEIETLLDNQKADPGVSSWEKGPCLILLDWIYPDENCIRVLTRLKEDPQLCMVPVLVVAENTDPGVVHRCYALNASFYLLRPVDSKALECFIHHLGQFLALEGIKLPLIRRPTIDPVTSR